MFSLYHHYDLERLAELLAVLLARRERGHVLEADTIIVPNRGVGRWLQGQLAESEGVAANLQLPLLARYIWEVIPRVMPHAPDSRDYERHRMCWHLYGLLPALAAEVPQIASYLGGDSVEVHRLQLAQRLADVFDQYLIYRPRMLSAWEQGRETAANPDVWQAQVWRSLTRRLGQNHRARLLDSFVKTIQGEVDPEQLGLPSAIYCFALGALPPEYVRFLYALARRIDVHFLLPNPCNGYWGDIESRRVSLVAQPPEHAAGNALELTASHPLLTSLGRGTRDLLRVLYAQELCGIQEPELGAALAYEPPRGSQLLARIQTDILNMAAPRGAGRGPADSSVQIHTCHGPLREVQVLQDQLLDLLAADPDLNPRDIVVMIPVISDYAPAIHSVFGAARGRRQIPYSLSDCSRSASHPIIQSFRQLLDLPLSRWTASEVLALAAVPAIMRRFGLDEAALHSLGDWAQAAGVRWGLDADNRAALGAGRSAQFTWEFGLDRLLLGLAQSDEETLVAGVAPWSDLEGRATAAVGALWRLVFRLRSWADELRAPASASAWLDRLNGLIAAFFSADPVDLAEQMALEELHEAVASLGGAADCLGAEELSWEAVRETLVGELETPGTRQPFLSGGLTFCGMEPLRAVPFKVVCLLGMNDGDYPRQERNRSFNALRARPQLGDHDVRADDRLLFLQALMSAREVFYISYVGQDVGSGESLPPSPIVGEWLDFLHACYFADRTRVQFEAELVAQQPMHPFGDRLFAVQPDHPRVFTFAAEWLPAIRAGGAARMPSTPFGDGTLASAPDGSVIDLGQLKRFFDHPVRYFFKERLQIRLQALEPDIEDEEPFALDGLNSWALRDALFRAACRDGSARIDEDISALWRARGALPPAPLDAAPYSAQARQVNAILPYWMRWVEAGEPQRLDIDVSIAGHRLIGRLNSVWPDGPRLIRPGSLRMQYRLRSWIDYLAYLASGRDGALRLAGLAKGSAVEFRARIDAETARAHLGVLLDLYWAGQRDALLFMPDLADMYLHSRASKDESEALAHLNGKLTNSFSPRPELSDPYLKLVFLEGQPLGTAPDDSRFCQLAEAICAEPVRHIVELPAGSP